MVSSETIRITGCSRLAIRLSADSGSPWEPVQISITRLDGSCSASLRSTRTPSGTLSRPRSRAICMLRTIERPTSATCRPDSTAASSTCCTRCTWLAKQATMTRPVARVMTSATTLPTSRSLGMKPGTSALVESDSSRSTPSSPSREKPGRSVIRPSSGVWSILKSPVCSTVPPEVRSATARASGIEWLTA